jgi:predicted PurR-regulated permease PerM
MANGRRTPRIPERTILQRWTFLVLFVLGTYLFWRTLEPIWIPVFLGLVIAVGVHPLQEKLVKRFRKHPSIPAALLTALVMIVALGFIAFLVFIVGNRIVQLAQELANKYQDQGPAGILGEKLTEALKEIGIEPGTLHERVGELVRYFAASAGKGAGALVAGTFSAIFIFIFTSLTSYYLLIEGSEGTSWLVEVIPLPDGQVREIVNNVRDVTRAMLFGTGITALYQGVIAFVGFWMFGVPSPVVWASLTGVASLLPGIGTALVWAPVGIVMMASGNVGKGLGVLAWGSLPIVFVADYIIRPRLVGTKMKMNDLLVFIAIFGGIEAFGILGLVLGPIAVAIFLSLIRIYQRDYRPDGPTRSPDVTDNGARQDR